MSARDLCEDCIFMSVSLPCIIFTVKQNGLSHKNPCICSHGGNVLHQLGKYNFENVHLKIFSVATRLSVAATVVGTPVWEPVSEIVTDGKLKRGFSKNSLTIYGMTLVSCSSNPSISFP